MRKQDSRRYHSIVPSTIGRAREAARAPAAAREMPARGASPSPAPLTCLQTTVAAAYTPFT
ncbi:hypothetical protein E2C01_045146 [Portunus trituberculatus]|uniref:Uncharacterized protein n=1 Tax=Portunus trituberculatus TaxID=210409 RepID=A0A5B7FUY4_PORTR|nr:hypothetical protein [Portunus trituberculatus]